MAAETLRDIIRHGAEAYGEQTAFRYKVKKEIIDKTYNEVKQYRNLVGYYTNKNISVSYLGAKKKNDTNRVMALYGNANERYW